MSVLQLYFIDRGTYVVAGHRFVLKLGAQFSCLAPYAFRVQMAVVNDMRSKPKRALKSVESSLEGKLVFVNLCACLSVWE